MIFACAYMSTYHISWQFDFIQKIEYYLTVELKDRDYGNGVLEAIYGIACYGPLSGTWIDSTTGTVHRPKYTRSKKLFQLTVNLSYNEIKSMIDDELIEIFQCGIMNSYDAVKSLKIKDFDVDAFYKDLETLLNDRDWLNHPEKYIRPPFVYKHDPSVSLDSNIPVSLKMKTKDFWELIEESRAHSNNNVSEQLKYLTQKLSSKKKTEIIGFEISLRHQIKKAYHYNVMGLLKVVVEHVSDDTLLYFSCRIILCGEELFKSIIKNPNVLNEKISYEDEAEMLLNVADKAFEVNYANDPESDIPSDVASEYFDYNNPNYDMTGKDWDENDFDKRYSALIKLYKK